MTEKSIDAERKEKRFKNIHFIIQTFYKSSMMLTVLLLSLSIIGGLMMAVELWAITGFINQVTEFSQWSLSYVKLLLYFSPFVGAFIGALLVSNLIDSVRPYLSAKLNEKVSVYLNNQLFEKSMKLELESFENPDYYNKLAYASGITQGELVYSLENAGRLLGMIIQFIVIVIAIYKVGIIYAVLLLLSSIPLFYTNIKANQDFNKVNYGQSQTRRKQGYWSGIAMSREMAAELRLLQLGTYILKRWKEETKELIEGLLKARTRMAVQRFKGEFFYLILLFTMMGATIYTGIQGGISLGLVVATLYLLDRLEDVINSVSINIEELSGFYFRFRAVPEFLELDEEEKSSGLPAPYKFRKGIQFENVSFKYSNQSHYALENVSFFLNPGERIAIVGENGAGKSTLCLLLLGLYRPTEGRIMIDGVDLTEIEPKDWRRKVASVFQNYVKYQLTAKENIAFGNIDYLHDEQMVKSAAIKGGIHAEIESLPSEYSTLLGKQYEGAHDLSGGQWQKVAISRAYFRDAELLVLDEPVSALDAQAEYEVYKQFSEVSVGKTVLIVSHRLGSARLANRILFFKDGRLEEVGHHDELMQMGGEYAALFDMQSTWYEEVTVKEAIE